MVAAFVFKRELGDPAALSSPDCRRRGRSGQTRTLLPLPPRRTWKGYSSLTSRTGNQPADQSMIDRRLMIVPPALPSRGHAEQREGQAKIFCAAA
jgi:hypothetical protein